MALVLTDGPGRYIDCIIADTNNGQIWRQEFLLVKLKLKTTTRSR